LVADPVNPLSPLTFGDIGAKRFPFQESNP